MKNKIIDSLIAIQAISFGKFTLKSGIISPIYIDLRVIISYPELLQDIAQAIIEMAKDLSYDRVAGIPYTALPMATAFSLKTSVPMLYCRKERKSYGTTRLIEGVYHKNEKVLIIDDLITNGASKFETLKIFKEEDLIITDVVVLIDREQGGKENLAKKDFRLHALISVFEIMDRVKDQGLISADVYVEVLAFLNSHKAPL